MHEGFDCLVFEARCVSRCGNSRSSSSEPCTHSAGELSRTEKTMQLQLQWLKLLGRDTILHEREPKEPRTSKSCKVGTRQLMKVALGSISFNES